MILISCDRSNRAMDVINDFYEYQHNGDEDFPEDMFASMEVAAQARSALSQRKMVYGVYVFHDRVGISRRVSFGKNGKKESVTYVCMVTGENGKTQETLMLERYGSSEPFRITAYVIKGIPIFHEPAPGVARDRDSEAPGVSLLIV